MNGLPRGLLLINDFCKDDLFCAMLDFIHPAILTDCLVFFVWQSQIVEKAVTMLNMASAHLLKDRIHSLLLLCFRLQASIDGLCIATLPSATDEQPQLCCI